MIPRKLFTFSGSKYEIVPLFEFDLFSLPIYHTSAVRFCNMHAWCLVYYLKCDSIVVNKLFIILFSKIVYYIV